MPHEIWLIKYWAIYQSSDAIIEETNRGRKRDLVEVPNESQWWRLFGNLDKMSEMHLKTFRGADVTDQKSKT